MDYVCKEFKEKSGIDLKEEEYLDELQELYLKAEKAKKELSAKNTATIALRVGKARESILLTRQQFSEMVSKTWDKTKRKMKAAIDAAGLKKEEIDRVLLVGGSSRIPFIQEEISAFLGKEGSFDINPDEAVAIGAAIYGKTVSEKEECLRFTDVCSHSIGIVVTKEDGKEENEKILLRNTRLPAETERRFRTIAENQRRLSVSITEGEYKELTDITIIGHFDITLPEGVPQHSLVLVSVGLDRHQLIHLGLKVPDIGFSEEYRMKRIANLDEEEIRTIKGVLQEVSVNRETSDCGQTEGEAEEPDSFRILGDQYRSILAELENLTGLASVKEQVKKRIITLEADRRAREAGALRNGGSGTIHLLFTGNPGTGKTTVARLLGKLYQELGVLKNGDKLVECNRGNLVGMYQGHTASNVQAKFKEAEGGILFIDEAYALIQDRGDSFGREAVDELVAQMENHRDSVMVILAGYDKDMDEFLNANPGLRSRIRNRIHFEDYSVEELQTIFLRFCEQNGMLLEPSAKEPLAEFIALRVKQPDFGNARGVRNLFDDVREIQNERLLTEEAKGNRLSAKDYDIITRRDIETAFGKKTTGEKTIEDLLGEISQLTGLEGAKKKIQEMVDQAEVRRAMEERGVKTEQDSGTLHLIFKGNAGTGKTTVARLLGEIYVKLGVLKKNVFLEVSRGDLVANYEGQTATRVLEKLDQAEGGILFIDEAYTLVNGEHDLFGREAVQTLVSELENRGDRLMCIVAGYGKEMDAFLAVNQGLKSRLSNEVIFEDYTLDEMQQIFYKMAEKKGLILEQGSEQAVRGMIENAKKGTANFGNARGVRNLLENCIRRKDSRIASSLREGKALENEELLTLRKEDLL